MKFFPKFARFITAAVFTITPFIDTAAWTEVCGSHIGVSNQIVIHFKMGYTGFPSPVKDSCALDDFIKNIKDAYSEGNLDNVEIYAYSCPAGDYKSCSKVAAKRAASLSAYIIEHTGIPADMICIKHTGLNWSGLLMLAEQDSSIPDRDKVLRILKETPEWIYDNNGIIVDGRKKQLMEVKGGEAFRYLLGHTFPQLRYAEANLNIKASLKESMTAEPEAKMPESASTTTDAARAATDTSAAVHSMTMVDTATAGQPPAVVEQTATVGQTSETVPEVEDRSQRMPRVAIKTNIPYWALVVPNLGVEIRLADHWSLDIPVLYSPFTVADTYRFRVLALQPSVRYWLTPGMKGHFFGVHLTGGAFNISVDETRRFQDTDGAWGAGIDYGYALNFNEHWGMEFNIGVGYIWSRYETFYNIENGAAYNTSILNYFGITRLGISLTYKL